jgi:hypothetical protein
VAGTKRNVKKGAMEIAKPTAERPASEVVEIRIEELVLHGFSPGDRHRIAGALKRELTRLVGEGTALKNLASPRAVAQIDGGAIRVEAKTNAAATGRRIARAVYRSLQRGTKAAATAPASGSTKPDGGSAQPPPAQPKKQQEAPSGVR